jgi:DNA-binding response OmpR family regulator
MAIGRNPDIPLSALPHGGADVAELAPVATSRDRPRCVLVVDDEVTVREIVARYLERDGFRVFQAADAAEAERLLERRPDIVVLDVMLPAGNGLDLLHRLRASSQVPVILLSARSDEIDRVVGLELGADDYVVKPFSPRELAARVRTILRRASPPPQTTPLTFDGLTIDTATREVFVDGGPVQMRAREFDVLAFLAASPRHVFSREQLLGHLWGSSSEFSDISTVTVHVRRIRQKIEKQPVRPRWITTVWGVGYRFEP